jgi:DNA-binding PadR family transcriptional regulator
VWEALEANDADDWDNVERQVNPLLYQLVDAGYVEEWGRSPTGSIWAISDAGHERLEALGRD